MTAFFEAVRVRDPILLSRVSMLSLDTLAFGPVQDFAIASVSDGPGTMQVTVEADGGPFLFTLKERDGGWVVASVTQPPASRTSP